MSKERSLPGVVIEAEWFLDPWILLTFYFSFLHLTARDRWFNSPNRFQELGLQPSQPAPATNRARDARESKTNHELATEMGFSVSTIRHETMRIYQALAVSDRKEAAKKAFAPQPDLVQPGPKTSPTSRPQARAW